MASTFIDTQQLSDHLGRDVTGDAGADLAVAFACGMVQDYAGQRLLSGSDTVTLDGSGTDALLLPERPATKVKTVTVGGEATTDWKLRSDGVLVHTTSTWTAGRQNVQVKYDHGWGASKVPQAVKMVALAVATRFFVQGPAVAETNGDQQVRYAGEATALMPTERIILDRYRAR